MEGLGIDDMVGIDTEGPQADDAEVLVANGDGVGRSPLLIQLGSGGEEIEIGLEGDSKSLSQFCR